MLRADCWLIIKMIWPLASAHLTSYGHCWEGWRNQSATPTKVLIRKVLEARASAVGSRRHILISLPLFLTLIASFRILKSGGSQKSSTYHVESPPLIVLQRDLKPPYKIKSILVVCILLCPPTHNNMHASRTLVWFWLSKGHHLTTQDLG